MHRIISFVLVLFCLGPLLAQQSSNRRRINLVENGDFEDGKIGFKSEYSYNFKENHPGEFSITDNASSLNSDFLNPISGDHTHGNGLYLVANSNGSSGMYVWQTEVEVVPNTLYKFSVFYCNLYKEQPVKTGFAFEEGDAKGNDPAIRFMVNGKQVGELDRDFYHLYRWINASVEWYSGTHNGKVVIGIENANTSIDGNDLAMDDVSFTYIKTMPDGYVPPELRTIMSAAYREEMAKNYKPSKRVISFSDIQKGDELSPGIYTIKYRPSNSKVDSVLEEKGSKFQLHNLYFTQGESEIPAAGKLELDELAVWLQDAPDIYLRIEGHTDNQGKQDLNVKLSLQRVENVKAYLMKKGIAEDRLETIGYGGALPIADNSKEETRKLNRRVEFEIIK